MSRVTFVQYFCYLVVSCTVTTLAGINLFTVEVNVECYSALSEKQHSVTTTRYPSAKLLKIPLILIFTYYLIDTIRITCILLYVMNQKVFGVASIVLQLNEFLGLATIGVLFYNRQYQFQARLCSGDYSKYSFDAVLTGRGTFLKAMLFLMPIYFVCQILLHIFLGFLQARDLEHECPFTCCRVLFAQNAKKKAHTHDEKGRLYTYKHQRDEMKKYRQLHRPWTFFIVNCVCIVAVLVLHPYFIATYSYALVDDYVYFFILIEVPLLIYLFFNILFLIIFKMEEYTKKLLKCRFLIIDFMALGILAGLIGVVVVYSQVKNSLESPSTLTYAQMIDYQKKKDALWLYLWLFVISLVQAIGFIIYSKILHAFYYDQPY
eukprot:403349070